VSTSSTWIVVVIAVLGSSALTAIVTVAIAPWRMRIEHKFRIRQTEVDYRFEQHRARNSAHETARSTYVPFAADAYRWADEMLWDTLGPDIGVFDPEGTSRDLPAQLPDILSELRRIWTEHPTSTVRSAAKELYESIGGRFSDVMSDPWTFESEKDFDLLREFRQSAEDLLELMHRPTD
jgi:hypothetical protein